MSEAKELKTVGEVIDALSEFPRNRPILGTWEGITRSLRVYNTPSVIIIDADEGDYQASLQGLRCECGATANGFHNGEPYCYTCWERKEDESN
jgi:hypothetical protein